MVIKIFQKSTAVFVAIVCLAFGIIAYADSSFNPVYSGKLSFNDTMYMYFSESNAECIVYTIKPMSDIDF